MVDFFYKKYPNVIYKTNVFLSYTGPNMYISKNIEIKTTRFWNFKTKISLY